jgi:hypothetical protein
MVLVVASSTLALFLLAAVALAVVILMVGVVVEVVALAGREATRHVISAHRRVR